MKAKKYSRVYVEITNICNRNCSFCPGTKRSARRMTLGELSYALDRIRPLTDYVYLHIMGEPLTHPELISMIRAVTERDMRCAITTNGTLLSGRVEELLESGVYKVNISLHSFETGTDSDYLKYIEGCLDFADRASARGILTVLRLWNRGYDDGRNIDTLGLIKARFVGCEWRMGERGARIRHRLHLEYGERFSWPDLNAPYYGEDVFCHGLGDHFGILCDGTVVPCCLDRDGNIPLGNIFESDIQSILSSQRATAICEGFSGKRAAEELCRRCGYARRFKI